MKRQNPLAQGVLMQSKTDGLIVAATRRPAQSPKSRSLPDLTDIIQALEDFQYFEPATKAAAIALYASELGIGQLHFYMISLHAGLGGGV